MMKITDEKRDHIVNMVVDELVTQDFCCLGFNEEILSVNREICTDIVNMILRELEIDVICDGEGPKN